jgi:hypothetical protein
MLQKNRKTPGVYITELTAFPPSVIGVQTAVPAFIGYTQKATLSGKPVFMKPIRIGSLADFQEIFGGEYDPLYEIKEVSKLADIEEHKFDFKVSEPPNAAPPTNGTWKYYSLTPDATVPQFNLYNSMRLFYANGGGNCFVVSVDSYQKPVAKGKLIEGLNIIKEQTGPTMLVVPEAILLPEPTASSNDYKDVIQEMLKQCLLLQDRVALLDVYNTLEVPALTSLDDLILKFREEVGEIGLNYGMSYFPFLHTTVVPLSDYDFMNLKPIDTAAGPENALETILKWQSKNLYWDWTKDVTTPRHDQVDAKINEMVKIAAQKPIDPKAVTSVSDDLMASLPVLGDIYRIILTKNDVLPPSPAMAGVYTFVDATRGVWNAPANLTLTSVDRTTYKLNGDQQGDLNVPVDGKAVNVIREFVGRGPVVWGARTLDGNSNDYRYIQVRRTLIYIEQSIKSALNKFVFAPNDGNTWVTVTAMCSNFLQGVWSAGGLMGATAADAYTVQCGLGSTMTGLDILNGYMIVQVTLQMIRPAEFIELTFKQKMEGVS